MRRRLVEQMSTSQRAGVVAAAASVPASLVPLAQPRSSLDQGLITGLTAAMNYSLTPVAHEHRGGSPAAFSGGQAKPHSRQYDADDPGGKPHDDGGFIGRMRGSSLSRGRVDWSWFSPGRCPTHGCDICGGAGCGLARRATGSKSSGQRDSEERPRHRGRWRWGIGNRSAPPYQVFARGRAPESDRLTSLGKIHRDGALTAAGRFPSPRIERRTARGWGRHFEGKGRKGQRRHRRPPGVPWCDWCCHLSDRRQVLHRAEMEMSVPDPALKDEPMSSRVSGGAGSLVAWESLTREARRHLSSATSRERIESVIGRPVLDPVRVYVGLTSAPTIDERVQLALEEIDRTDALNRSLLVLCSPTGSGFINYAASSAWEYLTGETPLPSPCSTPRVRRGCPLIA